MATLLLADAVYAQTGQITICRWPGITGLSDSKTVTVPRGSTFTYGGHPEPGPDDKEVLRVKTTAVAHIGPKSACATVTAEIVVNRTNKPVSAGIGKFVAQFDPEYGAELYAKTLTTFK
ncbi:MAG: hypothetical protein KGL39_55875 [Patescibacteria group bacterium]|nr:hypothetical protein [Patescibacteria group bacterium]